MTIEGIGTTISRIAKLAAPRANGVVGSGGRRSRLFNLFYDAGGLLDGFSLQQLLKPVVP